MHGVDTDQLNKFVIQSGNRFGPLDDFRIRHDGVKHLRRLGNNVADDMGIGAAVNGLAECPGFKPGFKLRQRHYRQKRHVGRAPLNRVQQSLVLQVAEKDVLLMVRHVHEVLAIVGQIDLFGTPEERELFFDQLFEDRVFLFVISRHIDRATEKHRFTCGVVVTRTESGI